MLEKSMSLQKDILRREVVPNLGAGIAGAEPSTAVPHPNPSVLLLLPALFLY